jgi:hypothetical protein
VRFLSPHPGYSVQVIQGREVRETDQVTGAPYTRTEVQPFIANFECGHGVFPHEVEIALEKFDGSFRGLPENTNPVTRIAVWDSEAHAKFNSWSDEYHKAVCDRLVNLAEQNPSRLVAVPDKWHAKPWPSYDEQDEDEIVSFVKILKIDPETVRLYEGENEQRESLMDTLQALSDGSYVEESTTEESDVVAVVSA